MEPDCLFRSFIADIPNSLESSPFPNHRDPTSPPNAQGPILYKVHCNNVLVVHSIWLVGSPPCDRKLGAAVATMVVEQ